MELAGKIRKFQFRDARPNAASEMKLEDAQRLLGHSKEQMTKAVYRRIGEKVRPTK
jgi:integrase